MMAKNKNTKICLIYTGGTIGMHRDANGILRPPAKEGSFLQVAPEIKHFADFDFVPLMNKDSTNMHTEDWTDIAKSIYDRRNNGYDGFVIAHGTDTMHFTASATALALGSNLNFPVVFTGAQTAPDILHGDARVNLVRAFMVASMDLAEVVICFGDYVFRGCRAQKKDERKFEAFESPAVFPLAHITEEILINYSLARKRGKRDDINLKAEFSSGIFQVSLIPSLEPSLLHELIENPNCKGFVLQSFGAGNVPDEGTYSWIDFIKKSRAAGKPVLITSQFPANATLHTSYAPGRAAVEAGAIPTGNMTCACATAKFRWVLAQVENIKDVEQKRSEIEHLMSTDFVGEFD